MADLTDEIAQYVTALFHEHQQPYLIYHNLAHTQSVVRHAMEIAEHYTLTSQEEFELIAAAWFHDTGHLSGDMNNHEQKSVKLMIDFLITKKVNPDSLTNISACIMATQMPARPVNLVEQILCDADTYHLGTDEFMKTNQFVWDETELRLQKKMEGRIEKSIRFLLDHQFFTSYCRQLLTKGKDRNIQFLKQMLQ